MKTLVCISALVLLSSRAGAQNLNVDLGMEFASPGDEALMDDSYGTANGDTSNFTAGLSILFQ